MYIYNYVLFIAIESIARHLHVLQQTVTRTRVLEGLSSMCGAYYKQARNFGVKMQDHRQDAFAFQ